MFVSPLPAEPSLPPVFRPIAGTGSAFPRILEAAQDGAGAGALAWSADEERLDVAVVFEPEQPLGAAWFAIYPLALAAADALAALGPPQVEVSLGWPDRLAVNGGTVGGLRLVAPPGPDEAPPAWLAAGLALRLRYRGCFDAPGLLRDETALEEEGFEIPGSAPLIEAFARSLLFWTDRWLAAGEAPILRHWRSRATAGPEGDDVTLDPASGDRLLPDGRRVPLAEALVRPSWSLTAVEAGRW